MSFAPPTIAQAIEVLVRHRPGITERQLAEGIFGGDGYQQRVNSDCRWLISMGYIKRDDSRPAGYTSTRPGPTEPQNSG
jgi:hypothetical protein